MVSLGNELLFRFVERDSFIVFWDFKFFIDKLSILILLFLIFLVIIIFDFNKYEGKEIFVRFCMFDVLFKYLNEMFFNMVVEILL